MSLAVLEIPRKNRPRLEANERPPSFEHKEPEHSVSNKNKCTVIYLYPCVFLGSFRRDLNNLRSYPPSLYLNKK